MKNCICGQKDKKKAKKQKYFQEKSPHGRWFFCEQADVENRKKPEVCRRCLNCGALEWEG